MRVRAQGGYHRSTTRPAQKILDEALGLTEEEHLEIANNLLESVEGAGDLDWEDAWATEVEARLERYRQGIDKATPWSDVRARIEKRLERK